MKAFVKTPSVLLAVLSVFPNLVFAHQVGGNGLHSGLTHPLFGFDHLLAMLAVGIVSTQINAKSVWRLPAVFVLFMIFGGILGMKNIEIPFIEMGIALSVLFLGIVISFSKKISMNFVLTCVAIFAVFHGHAHGEEMPQITNPIFYVMGFVLSTTFLHIVGIGIGHYAQKTDFTCKLLRFSGAGISTMGFLFLLG